MKRRYWQDIAGSRDAFVQAYRNSPIERIDLDPKTFFGGIGHKGYFRQKAQPLWDAVLECFNQSQSCNNGINPRETYEN